MLRRKIADELLPRDGAAAARGHVQSFGFKHGPARDADLALRRALPAEPALRARAAPADRPRPARRRLRRPRRARSTSSTSGCCRCSTTCCPQYVAEGKAHLMVAIGCTGGRHRSVAIAEHLARALPRARRLLVEVVHRDIEKPRASSDRVRPPASGCGLIDHVGLEVCDLERSARFYDAVFYPLGGRRMLERAGRDRLRRRRARAVARRARPRAGAGFGPRRAQGAREGGGRRRATTPGVAHGGRDDGAAGPAPAVRAAATTRAYLRDPDGCAGGR